VTEKYLTVEFTVEAPADRAFAAINNPRGWWSEEITGESTAVGDEFTYVYGDIHRSTQRVTELLPNTKVVWHVLEGYLNFTKDPAEWTGTDVVFDLTRAGDATHVRLTHVGLTPEIECFEACSRGWGYYAGESLPQLILAGAGDPNEVGTVRA
jgi:Activator of Hsp90 ATPase homolog 1-like protein